MQLEGGARSPQARGRRGVVLQRSGIPACSAGIPLVLKAPGMIFFAGARSPPGTAQRPAPAGLPAARVRQRRRRLGRTVCRRRRGSPRRFHAIEQRVDPHHRVTATVTGSTPAGAIRPSAGAAMIARRPKAASADRRLRARNWSYRRSPRPRRGRSFHLCRQSGRRFRPAAAGAAMPCVKRRTKRRLHKPWTRSRYA